jgi:hypothetical protein
VQRVKSISKASLVHGLLECPICADYRALFVLEGNNPQRSDEFSNAKKLSSRVAPTNALWIDQPDYQEHSVVFAKLQSLSNLRSDKQRFIFISGRMRKRKDEGKEISRLEREKRPFSALRNTRSAWSFNDALATTFSFSKA